MSWGQGSTRAGRKARQQCLDDADYQCQLRYPGCLGYATIADHTVNIATLGLSRAEATDPDLLQAVCTSCHDTKTKRETLRANEAKQRYRNTRRHRPATPHPGD